MCLMTSTPPDVAESRIASASQFMAMVERERRDEREWMGKA